MNHRFCSIISRIAVAVVLSCLISLSAQTRLGYSIILESPAYRDDALVSLAFRGGGLAPGLLADHQFGKWRLNEKIDFGMAYAANRYSHGSVQFRLWGHLALYRTLCSPSSIGTIELGIPFNLRFNDRYMYSWDDAHLYWHTSHWTGISSVYRKELKKNLHLKCSLSLPLFALVATSSNVHFNKQDAITHVDFWFSQPSKNLRPATWGKYNGFDLSAGLQHHAQRSEMEFDIGYTCSFWSEVPRSQMSLLQIRFTQKWKVGK